MEVQAKVPSWVLKKDILILYVVFFIVLAARVDVGVDEDGDHCEPSHHRLDPRKS